jgi:signal transduction histidine kinase
VRLPFRKRILLVVLLLGVLPTALALVGLAIAVRSPAGTTRANREIMEDLARTGRTLVQTLDTARLRPADRKALVAHSKALNDAISRGQRQDTYAAYYSYILPILVLVIGAVVLGVAVRLGGYLSRQLSRPIEELIGWTGNIRRAEPLPPDEREGGAPEFASLRLALREMASGLAEARVREIEGERLRAFREVARRVAHEMKNPLTPMRFAVSQLTRNGHAEQREALEVLQAESARLEQLASEFTEMGRLPEGPAAEVDLGELLAELARTALPAGVTPAVNVDPETPRITGHYEPLRRALGNLLRNASEAVSGRGEVGLQCRPLGKNGAEIRIVDHGPGVPDALQERLFDAYVTGKVDGTGLGLALVRQTVEAHGGRVWHEATPGGGATFVITLPKRRVRE